MSETEKTNNQNATSKPGEYQGRGRGRGQGRGQGRGRGRGEANKKPFQTTQDTNTEGDGAEKKKLYRTFPKHIEELEKNLSDPIEQKLTQIQADITAVQEEIKGKNHTKSQLNQQKESERSKSFERLKQISQELKKYFADKSHHTSEIKILRNELREHKAYFNTLKQNLRYKNFKDPEFIAKKSRKLRF